MDIFYKKYQEKGFVTIPLNKKIPYIKEWQKITESKEIKNKDENIGVLTGKVSNITIIDIDIQDDGMKMWNKLISIYGDIETVKVKTVNNGLHYYFKYDDSIKSTNKIKINGKKYGIDVLNDKKQAVIPPSRIDKKKYKFINSLEEYEILNIPDWLKIIVKNEC